LILKREFSFDAAHYLPDYHGKCERLHGHTYRAALFVEGVPDEEGMVMDFVELKESIRERVLSKLDHACLNDIIKRPSAEYIALWIWKEMVPVIDDGRRSLKYVQVWESPESSVLIDRSDFENFYGRLEVKR